MMPIKRIGETEVLRMSVPNYKMGWTLFLCVFYIFTYRLCSCYWLSQAGAGAAVLAIGTANPATCLPQEEYADWYFRVTKRDHLTKLKAKMKKISKILIDVVSIRRVGLNTCQEVC